MGTNTTKLGLYKPSASEDFSVSHANGNMDLIDTAFGKAVYNGQYAASTSAANNISIGYGLTAKNYNTVMGVYNNTSTTTAISNINSSTDTGSVFVVGCGTSTAGKNALRITKGGLLYASSSIVTSGADYAEYFEWADGNPNNEDRVGRLVTMDGMYIRLAQPNEWILGIVSAAPCFLGDGQEEEWQGMYIKDVYGRKMIVDGEYVLNPDYDPTIELKGRQYRPEWSPVGLVGKLVVDDDGTAEVNGFITTGKDGIATASKTETRFRVIERLDDHHIKVVKI